MVEVKILREREVVNRTGLSRSTIWRYERSGEFPPRVRITERTMGWLESDVTTWIESKTLHAPDGRKRNPAVSGTV